MARKFFASLLVALLFTSGAWAYYYEDGHEGTEDDPYIIDEYNDLYQLWYRANDRREPEGKYYKLTRDISISGNWLSIGIVSSYGAPFTGHFDGDGNTITITAGGSLFGAISADGVAVTNLRVSGDINSFYYKSSSSVSDTSDNFYTGGGIAAFLISGTIEYCDFQGIVSNDSDTMWNQTAGGIVGYMKDGTIKNCTVNGKFLSATYTTSSNYVPNSGGIVGCMTGGTIQDCTVTSKSEIRAYTRMTESHAGGIVGYANSASASIKNNKISAIINSKQYAGGISGFMSGGGTLENNKVLTGTEISADYTAGGITGYFGVGYCQSNDITMDSLVYVVNQAAGGIVGRLASGTVRYNKADTQVSGSAKYNGKIIGEITGLNYSVYGNTYGNSNTPGYLIGYDKKTSGPSNNNTDGSSGNDESDSGNNNDNLTPTPTPNNNEEQDNDNTDSNLTPTPNTNDNSDTDMDTNTNDNTNTNTNDNKNDNVSDNDNSNENNNSNDNANENNNKNETSVDVENKNTNDSDNTTNVNVKVEINNEANQVQENIQENNDVDVDVDEEKKGGLLSSVAEAATGGGGGCNAGFSLGIFAVWLILRRR